MDKLALSKLFTDFGYEMRLRENLEAQQLMGSLTELSNENFDNYGSLVVCILSHGEEGVVDGVDGQPVGIEKLKQMFTNSPTERSSLYGKPKIWIIAACQGEGYQEDILLARKETAPSGILDKTNECIIFVICFYLLYLLQNREVSSPTWSTTFPYKIVLLLVYIKYIFIYFLFFLKKNFISNFNQLTQQGHYRNQNDHPCQISLISELPFLDS